MQKVEDQYGSVGFNKDISSKLQGLHTRGKSLKLRSLMTVSRTKYQKLLGVIHNMACRYLKGTF